MKHFIKKLLREYWGSIEVGEGPQIFLRKTISPENDLIRNFSCYANAWFNTKEEAQHYYDTQASFAQEPRQDPVTNKWCGSVEDGLSAFVIETEEQYYDAIKYLNDIPHLKSIKEISVFISNDYYLESGSDGEDTFTGGKFLFTIPPTMTYEEFSSKLNQFKGK